MYNYCTLFDSSYLSRGLAMYESLKRNSSGFHLYIFPFDMLTYDILIRMKLENVTVISQEQFETIELLEAKKLRTKAEYCWTCTPSTIYHILVNFGVPDCTYIDADLFFYSDPSVLISEMEEFKKDVLITEHRYSTLPRLYEEKRSGRFCVQFVTFRNNEESMKVLDRWRMQCINWCYARHEDGKFGDQKYLDEWPSRYNNVHILEHPGGGVAPWNVLKYSFTGKDVSITGRIKSRGFLFDLVFYHFQYVKFLSDDSYDIGWYILPSDIKRLIYMPYLKKLGEIEKMLKQMDNSYTTKYFSLQVSGFKDLLKAGIKKIFNYNIIRITNGLSD